MSNRIIQRHDKAANWELYNPVLAEGELGFITDQKNRYKIGDGITAWKDLPLQGFNGNIVNETGDDEGSVMSQKGVTQKLTELEGDVQTLKGSAIFEDDLSVVISSKNLANPNNVENGLINSSGEHVPLVGDPWNMLKVPVTPGQILTFGGFYLGRTAYYAFYNDNTLVSFAQFNDPNGTQTPVTVTVPEGANILYIDISTNLSPANPFQFMQVNIGEQLAEYDEFSESIESIKGIKVIGDGGSQGEIVDLIADLPVSDGTNIPVGYAYIDSASSVVKVKTA